MTRLTPREKQIARLLAKGYSQKQIAYRLGIKRATAYRHTLNARSKLKMTTAEIAVTVARENG